MSKLNLKGSTKPKKLVNKRTNTPVVKGTSYNGNVQYVKDAAQQLYELAVMSLYGKDTYYETSSQQVDRLVSCVNSVVKDGDANFVANLIVHARGPMKIRSMPIVLAVHFARALRENKLIFPQMRQVIRDVIQRADQISDLYAVALSVFGDKKSIPTAIKRGVGDAFNKFNEYQFSKYNRSGEVKLKDVLRIVHPEAVDKIQGDLFDRIMKDSLQVAYTWETELSANGTKGTEQKSKKDLWTDLVNSDKVGYMALLRNLRNMVEAEMAPAAYDKVASILQNPDRVEKSKQLPFSFIKALDALGYLKLCDRPDPNRGWSYAQAQATQKFVAGNVKQKNAVSKLSEAISEAIEHSLGNIPRLGESVWVIMDCSGSMNGYPFETACLFAAALAKSSRGCTNFMLTMFSDNAFHVDVRRSDSVLTNFERMLKRNVGGGTALASALKLKSSLGFQPDTVIVLSDMQVNSLSGYGVDPMKIFDKNVVKIAMNLNAYETTPTHEAGGWIQLGGFSEKVFDFVGAIREKQSVFDTLNRPYVEQKVRLPSRGKKVDPAEVGEDPQELAA